MFDGIKVNLNEISFYLWIAVGSLIFSIFSLKYNTEFIYVGFISFAFGIVGHMVDKILKNNRVKEFILIILFVSWIYFCFKLLSV